MSPCICLGNCLFRQKLAIELEQLIEEFPGGINGERITRIVEKGLEGEICVFGQRGFDDDLLIGAMLIDKWGNPWGKRTCVQWAGTIVTEVCVGLDNGVQGHIGDLPYILHVNVCDQIPEPQQGLDHANTFFAR